MSLTRCERCGGVRWAGRGCPGCRRPPGRAAALGASLLAMGVGEVAAQPASEAAIVEPVPAGVVPLYGVPPDQRAPRTRGAWSVGLGVRPEVAALGAGGGFQSMFRYRVVDTVALDFVGRSVFGAGYDDPDELYLALGFGAAWTPVTAIDAWAPRVSGRFTHVHHASLESWGDTPLANAGGDSSGGVRHRSGAELAAGAVAPALTDLGGNALRWEIELTGSVLPSSEFFAWQAGLVIGLVLEGVAD